MKLTTKGRYAVMAMADLAANENVKPVSLNEIAVRQNISLSYLEQLFSKLRQKSLVQSVRGPGGGYLLKKQVSDISIADVIDAVDESLDTTKCKEKGDCQEGETCLTHHLWLDLSLQIHSFLSNITLQDLMNKREVQITALRQDQQAELINAQLLNI